MIESNIIIFVLVGALKILTRSRADAVSQELACHQRLVRWLRIPDIMCMARVTFVGSVRGLAVGAPVSRIKKNQPFKIPLHWWIHWTTSATIWAKYKTKFKSHVRISYLLQATEKRMVFVKQLRSSSLTAKVIHPRFHKMRIYSLRKAKKRPRATLSRK